MHTGFICSLITNLGNTVFREKNRKRLESTGSRVSGSSRLGARARNPLQPCRVCNFVAYADPIVYRNVNGLRVYIYVCTFVKEKKIPPRLEGGLPLPKNV